MFGAQKSNTFGSTGLNLGGFSSPGATTGFGATKTPFGGQSGFGTTGGSPTTSGAFGLNKLSTFPGTGGILGGGFGSPSVPSAFGTQQPAQTAGFGGFGAPSVGGFGTTNTLTFGAPSAQQQQGTGAPPFKPTEKYEDSTNNSGKTVKVPTYLHVITAMTEYTTKSFEELRFEDYNKGNKTGAAGMNMGFGGIKPVGFGTSSSTGSPFGASSTTNAFGSTTTTAASPFGGGAAFGSTPSTTGLTFGSSTASSPFGGSSFGASSQPTFGSKPAATTGFGATGGFGGFGSTSAAPAFGTTSSTPAFGSAAPFGSTGSAFGSTSGGFGAATTGNTGAFGSTGSGLTFGSTPTTTFGSTASTGAFGTPGGFGTGSGTTGFGGFGATNTQSAFGSTSSSSAPFGTTATGSSPFGSSGLSFGANGQQQSAFGKPAGSLGFGTTTPTTFGAKPNTSPFGTTSGFGQQSSTTGAFGQSSTPSFGTTGGFGSPSGTTGFGASPFGTPATGTGFGGSAFGTAGGTTGGFGASAASPFGTTGTAGGFGTATSQGATTFGSLGGGGMQSTGGFGSAFGAPTTTSTGFGTGATGGFGTTGAGLGTTGGFGGTTGGFGTGALGGFGTGPTLSNGFGSAASTSKGFGLGGSSFGTGATTAAPGFGGLSTGLGLGQSSGFGGTSGFGTTATTGGFGSTLGTSGFGAPSTGFGAGSTFGGFGTTDPNKQSQGFQGFGSNLMGAPQGGTGLGFGGMNVGQPMGMTTMNVQPAHSSAVLGPMFEQLKQRKKDVLEIRLNQKESTPSTTAQASMAGLTSPSMTSTTLTRSRQAPRSTSRITPRTPRSSVTAGLTSPSLTSSVSLRSESSILSPDLFFAKSSKKLVIDQHPDDFDPGADLPMPPQRSLTQHSSPYLNGSSIMDMSLTSITQANPKEYGLAALTTTATPTSKSQDRRDGTMGGGDITTPSVLESPSFQLNRADLPGSSIPSDTPPPSAAATPSVNRLNLHHSDDALNTPYLNNHNSQSGMPYSNRFQSDVNREHLTPSTTERTQKDTTSNGYISSGSNLMNGSRLSDQIGESPPQNDRDVAPILTKSGYFSNPDIRILREMSASELKSVPKFTVFRPGIGRIEWEGETDIRGLNLDKIVRIEQNTVDVYDDEETKPEIGQGLNKPAIIILNKVFPKSTTTSLKKREDFINKLRASCVKNGSEFLDYDEDSGDWVLRALHFSKYGLADDSDEEEGQIAPPPSTTASTATVINTSSKKKSGGTSVSFARNISSPFPNTPGTGTGRENILDDQENDCYLSNNDFSSTSYRGGDGSSFLSPPSSSSLRAQSNSHQNFLRSGARVEDLYTADSSGRDEDGTTSRVFTPMSVVSNSNRTRQGTPFPKGYDRTGSSLPTPTTPSTPLFRNTFRGSLVPYTPLDGDASSSGIVDGSPPSPYHPYRGAESMDLVPSYQQRLPSFPSTASPFLGGKFHSDDEKISKPMEIGIAEGTSTYEPIQMPNYYQKGFSLNAVIPEEFLAAARIPIPTWPSQESPCMKIMLALRQKSSGGGIGGGQSTKCTSVSGTETIRPPRSPRDMALFMGHSFRVSWTVDGRIVHAGKPVFHSNSIAPTSYNVTVEKVDTFHQLNIDNKSQLNEEDRQQLLFYPLEALLQVSSMSINTTPSLPSKLYQTNDNEKLDENDSHQLGTSNNNNNINVVEEDQIPRWQTPRVNAWAIDHEYVLFTQMVKKLINTLSELQSLPPPPSSSSSAAILINPLFQYEKSGWVILQTIKLVEALCGQHPDWLHRISSGEEKGDVIIPLFEKRHGIDSFLWEQRRESLSLWLKQLVDVVVVTTGTSPNIQSGYNAVTSTSSSGVESVGHGRILELLSRGQVEDAVEVAKSSGHSRLATVLSLLHGDDTVKQLIAKQLLDWKDQMVMYGAGDDLPEDTLDQEDSASGRMSAERHVIPFSLLSIYAVLGGAETMLGIADIGIDSILRNMNWMNALAMLFWYGGSSIGKLHTALSRYEEALEYQLVRPPLSPLDASIIRQQQQQQQQQQQHQVEEVDEKSTPSAIFSLLQVLLAPENIKKKRLQQISQSSIIDGNIIQCLNPMGFSTDLLDYRGSYLVLSLLESLQLIERNTVTASIVRSHTIFQLLSEGLWHWAIFVALQFEYDHDRQSIVKDIVCRYGGYSGWENEVDSLEKFLVERLNVPEKWIHTATAYRCKCQGDAYAETAYLTLSGLWKEADIVVCHTLAPLSFYASNAALMKLQDLLIQMESHVVDSMHAGNTWRLGGGVILDYLRLKESIQQFGRIADEMDGEEELNNLITEIITTATSLFIDVSKLMEIFTSRNRNLTNQTTSTSMYQIMLFEMGSYLFKILSEFHTKLPSNSEIYSLEEFKTAPIILAEGGKLKNYSGRKSFGVILEDC